MLLIASRYQGALDVNAKTYTSRPFPIRRWHRRQPPATILIHNIRFIKCISDLTHLSIAGSLTTVFFIKGCVQVPTLWSSSIWPCKFALVPSYQFASEAVFNSFSFHDNTLISISISLLLLYLLRRNSLLTFTTWFYDFSIRTTPAVCPADFNTYCIKNTTYE